MLGGTHSMAESSDSSTGDIFKLYRSHGTYAEVHGWGPTRTSEPILAHLFSQGVHRPRLPLRNHAIAPHLKQLLVIRLDDDRRITIPEGPHRCNDPLKADCERTPLVLSPVAVWHAERKASSAFSDTVPMRSDSDNGPSSRWNALRVASPVCCDPWQASAPKHNDS
ncbi:hypothetical protein PENSPDRAFT_288729 [Peniophora sp. CONT]|nr:hypothetical protein PENSPDRAFT_288729 [Peniophora sp. CONT]